MATDRLYALAIERGALLAVVTTALFLWLAPSHVIDGDNGEFATLSVTGGSAHPTGYPLYVLWLRALSWLPGSSPAHTAALATALLGGLGVLVLFQACRAWGARAPAATVAVALFATGPVVLRVVTEAEVFTLNNLIVATVLWLSANRGPLRGGARAGALGLVAGLGIANHVTCVLVAPVGLLGVVRAIGELETARLRAPRVIAIAVVGLALGLTPYLYLLVAPDTPMSWGTVRDLDRLLAMFLREDYGGPVAFLPSAVDVPASVNLLAFARTLGSVWLWVPAIAGVAMLGLRAARRSSEPGVEPPVGWALLALAWLICGPLLVMRFNVVPDGLGLYVNQRFHLLPALLLAVPVAHALDRVSVPRATLVTTIAATVGVLLLSARSLSYVGRVQSPAVEVGTMNMLGSLPPAAVVLHSQDELHFVPGYVQTALGFRQDVAVVMWTLMTHSWYRDRLAKRGVVSGPGAGTPEVRLVANLLARGRPVFVDRFQRDVTAAFSTYPHGVLMRVIGPTEPMPTVQQVFELNEQLFARFALDYPKPGPDDEYATEVHRRYAHTWKLIAVGLDREHLTALAERAREYARKLAPAD